MTSLGKLMHSQPNTLKAFTDAAADAVAREIATVRREAQRERDIQSAEYRARLAKLDARISSVCDLERRLEDRIVSIRDGRDGTDGKDGVSISIDDVMPLLASQLERSIGESVERVLATWEKPKDGTSVEMVDVEPVLSGMVRDAIAALPPPKDGKDGVDGEPGKNADPDVIRAMVAEAVADLPPPVPGRDADPAEVRRLVDEAVAALPPVPPGKDADPEFVRQLVAESVAALPPAPAGPPGERGPTGMLPIVKDWSDRVHYAGEVVTYDGATWQAACDTGRGPPHADWTCLASAGRDGYDGRSFTVRGTFSPDAEYSALDVVALNGAAFVAKRDAPGPCPGDGWQMIASQGKRGQPGERGPTGGKGGPGPALIAMHVDGEGLLTAVNADGSTISCDLYPILAKISR